MNNNIENTAVQTKTFTLPENDEFSAEDLADDYAGLQLSFRRVKIPSGGTTQFEVPGDDMSNILRVLLYTAICQTLSGRKAQSMTTILLRFVFLLTVL